MKIILGSGSPWRARILAEMGYNFEIMPPDIDEKAVRRDDPKELVLALAEAKARHLRPRIDKHSVLITSDQVVTCGGRMLEKPKDEAQAREFIALAGQHESETISSVMVVNTETGKEAKGIDIAKIWFKPIPEDVVDKIIAKGDIYRVSGGLDADDPLVRPFVVKREGTIDSILGLPKELTKRLLKEVGAQSYGVF
jgi:septum formation protein